MRAVVGGILVASACVFHTSVSLADDAVRCFALPEPMVRAACVRAGSELASPAQDVATTADTVAPTAPARFMDLQASALLASPSAYVGRPLRIHGATCSYVDVGDYRCRMPGPQPIVVRTAVIMPPPAQNAIETRCGTLHSGQHSACTSSVLFVPNTVRAEGESGARTFVLETSSLVVDEAARRHLNGRRY